MCRSFLLTRHFLLVLWSLGALARLILALEFTEVTKTVDLDSSSGTLAALADFNQDKLTDILVLNTSGSEHSLFLWSSDGKTFHRTLLKLDTPLPIVRVGVADFDGDGVPDIVTFSEIDSERSCCLATLHWCELHGDRTVTVSSNTMLKDHVTGYPLILEIVAYHHLSFFVVDCLSPSSYNGDQLADFGGISSDGDYTVWTGSMNRNFSRIVIFSQKQYTVYSSYSVDLDSDCIPELVLYVSDGTSRAFFVLNKATHSGADSPLTLPGELQTPAVIGIPVFADMDADGLMEVVLLSCHDNQCHQPTVHVVLLKKFPEADVSHCKKDESWTLQFDTVTSVELPRVIVPEGDTLRLTVGDVNLDGFPDLLLPAFDNHTAQSYPLLLLGGGHGNKLLPQLLTEPRYANTTQAVLFDLYENGVPDLLLVQGRAEGETRVTAHQQRLEEDHSFLKVLVLSRLCFSSTCDDETYTSMLPGATVSFSTTDRNGHREVGMAVVRGTGDSPLQLPFILFGLGETPSFIESLTIGIAYTLPPGNVTSWRVSHREWTLLVPNSQVVMLTQHPDNPASWKMELYLTPSGLIYSTAGVLGAIAVVMATIIALLQARERFQDSKERKQAKHRFHFNAM